MNGNEKQVYPPRGEMSADGRQYTHTDGSVHEQQFYVVGCKECSLMNLTCHLCNDGSTTHPWRLVDGAYVTSDEEREACDMARDAIRACDLMSSIGTPLLCRGCPKLSDKSCPARLYLAKHGDPDAWEVPE